MKNTMKKKNRLISFILIILIIFNITAVVALGATDAERADRKKYLENIKAPIVNSLKRTPSVLDGVSDVSPSLVITSLTSAANYLVTNYGNSTTPPVNETTELAIIFAADYGLTNAVTIGTILAEAYLAKNEADSLYNEEVYKWLHDAFRHTTWNFRAAKAVGAENTRVFTTCYEWANVLYKDWQVHYTEMENFYIQTYGNDITTQQAKEWARADANDYAIALRDALQNEALNYHWIFRQVFCDAETHEATEFYYPCIMDFWNNKIGRNYASSNASLSPQAMFNLALQNGDLITAQPTSTGISSISASVFLGSYWYLI